MKWIDLNKEKPNYGTFVWVLDKYGQEQVAFYVKDEDDYFSEVQWQVPLHSITHWCPILPPKEFA